MNRIRIVRAALALGAAGAAVAALGMPGSAGSGSWHKSLSGAYGMTLSQSCVLPPLGPPPNPGFAPDGSLLQPAEIVSATGTGVLRFSRDGRVSLEQGRLGELFHGRTQVGDVPLAAPSTYSCSGGYDLDADQRLTLDLACQVDAPRPGIEISVGPFILTGFASRERESLSLAALEGTLQTVEVSAGGQVVQRRERICLQQLTLVRL